MSHTSFNSKTELTISEAQKKVEQFAKDQNWKTESLEIFNHLVEEIGEIARGLRKGDKENLKKELEEINPNLIEKYKIQYKISFDSFIQCDEKEDVQLVRGETSIVSNKDFGHLVYEIFPRKNGIGFSERFGTGRDVAYVTLRNAVEIAEALEENSPELEDLVRKYF